MKSNPSFCTIAPTQYLPQFARKIRSDYHLLLAHLIDHQSSVYDKEYADFYASTKRPNEVYIMDCGAFELGESYAPDRLIRIGQSVRADILVLPDYPGKSWTVTRDSAIEHIPSFKAAGFKTFYVPQSALGDWDGWMDGFEWALFNPDIDVIGLSILAHPIALPQYPQSYVRVVAADRIRKWLDASPERAAAFDAKHIHWLGLLSPGLEIPPLLAMRLVDTLDSSNPVWFGHCGHRYNLTCDGWTPVTKRMVPEVDFSAKVNKHALGTITYNLDRIEDAFLINFANTQK